MRRQYWPAAVVVWMAVCMLGAVATLAIGWAMPPGDENGEYLLRVLTAFGIFAVGVAQMVLGLAREHRGFDIPTRNAAEGAKAPHNRRRDMPETPVRASQNRYFLYGLLAGLVFGLLIGVLVGISRGA